MKKTRIADLSWVRPGARVHHPRYGFGTVCSQIYTAPSQPCARVIFADATRTIRIHSRRRAAGLRQIKENRNV